MPNGILMRQRRSRGTRPGPPWRGGIRGRRRRRRRPTRSRTCRRDRTPPRSDHSMKLRAPCDGRRRVPANRLGLRDCCRTGSGQAGIPSRGGPRSSGPPPSLSVGATRSQIARERPAGRLAAARRERTPPPQGLPADPAVGGGTVQRGGNASRPGPAGVRRTRRPGPCACRRNCEAEIVALPHPAVPSQLPPGLTASSRTALSGIPSCPTLRVIPQTKADLSTSPSCSPSTGKRYRTLKSPGGADWALPSLFEDGGFAAAAIAGAQPVAGPSGSFGRNPADARDPPTSRDRPHPHGRLPILREHRSVRRSSGRHLSGSPVRNPGSHSVDPVPPDAPGLK